MMSSHINAGASDFKRKSNVHWGDSQELRSCRNVSIVLCLYSIYFLSNEKCNFIRNYRVKNKKVFVN